MKIIFKNIYYSVARGNNTGCYFPIGSVGMWTWCAGKFGIAKPAPSPIGLHDHHFDTLLKRLIPQEMICKFLLVKTTFESAAITTLQQTVPLQLPVRLDQRIIPNEAVSIFC